MVSYKQERDSSRPRRARNSLTRSEIVVAAREVLTERGEAGFTLRAVGERLGASAMALYNHVTSKDDLLDATLDSVLLELGLRDDPTQPPAEVLLGFAERHLAHLRAHPWAVTALLARPSPGIGAMIAGEAYLAVALRAGGRPAEAVQLFTGVLAVIYGAAAFLAGPGTASTRQDREAVEATITEAQAAMFPATAAVAGELAEYGSPEQLRGILTALIGGLLPDRQGDAART
jgi:AcrR family transcriptional regulator